MSSKRMAASHEETPTAVRVVYVVSRIVEVVNLAAGGNVLSQQMRRLHDLIKNDKERNRQEHAQELWDTEPRTAQIHIHDYAYYDHSMIILCILCLL